MWVPTQWQFLNQTCTLSVPSIIATAAGFPETAADPTTYANWPCNLQPMSSSESLQFQRETRTILAKLFLSPLSDAGVAAASLAMTRANVTIGGVEWRVIGDGMNIGSDDSIVQLAVEREA